MAALQEFPIPKEVLQLAESEIKKFLAQQFWAWFDAHADDKVKDVKLWLFHKTVYLRDFQSVAELFFGKRV